MMSKRAHSILYRADVDGLRALAVLAVIIGHLNPAALPSGFLGVDIFFVISGFVITASLEANEAKSWADYLQTFYTKRFKRLVPALLTCFFVTTLVFLLLTAYSSVFFKTGLSALVGGSNLFLLNENANYFGKSIRLNPFTHTWSLGVEEQFYFFFPVILALCGFSKIKKANGVKNLRITIFLLSATSLIGFLGFNQNLPHASFYLMPLRFWELGLGCLTYLFSKLRVPATSERASVEAWASGLTALLLIALLFVPEEFRALNTLAVALSTSSLIYWMKSNSIAKRLFSLKPIVGLGLGSYSLYLWHWPVLALYRNLYGFQGAPTFILFALAALVSVFSYHFIEKPFRKMKWGRGNEKHTLVYGMAAIIMVALTATFLYQEKSFLELSPVRRVSPTFVKTNACHLPSGPHPIESCLLPKESNTPERRIFLMGDSHASNLVRALQNIASKKNYEFRYLTDRALVNHLVGKKECGGTACVDDEVGARINFLKNHLRAGDIFIFSMARDHVHTSKETLYFSPEKMRLDFAPEIEKLSHHLDAMLETVQSMGGKTILVQDLPKICTSDEFEVWKNGHTPCELPRAQSLLHRQALSNVYESLAKIHTNTTLVDPHPYFCPNELCTNFLDGKIIYADGSPHLTDDSTALLEKILAPALN